MADLILLPTLERLQPHDDEDAKLKAFGLTFSVALGESHTPETFPVANSFLTPWNWEEDASNLFQPIEEVSLLSLDGAQRTGPFKVKQEVQQPSGFRRALNRRFGEFKVSKDITADWSWAEGTADTKKRTVISRERRSWSAFVGQVSLYPYPLPQGVGLSSRLEMISETALPAQDYVVVAPILKLRHEGWDFVLRADFLKKDNQRVTLVYAVEKAVQVPPPPGAPPPPDPAPPPPPAPTQPPFSIQVETMACSLGSLPQNGYFNFQNLWVRMRPEDISNSEWRAGLEVRLAEQLHVARIIVDWLIEEVQKAPRPALPDYPTIAAIVLQQIMETFGPGLREGPEGKFLDRARFFGKEPVPRSSVVDLSKEATEWLKKVKEPARIEWIRQAVTGTAPSGSGLLDLAARGETQAERARLLGSLSLEQTVGSLDQLLASLSSPATLRELFRIQWQAFLDSEKPEPSKTAREFAEALVSGLPPEVDLQRLLLLDHLGGYWETFKTALVNPEALAKAYQENILKPLGVPGWTETFQGQLAKKIAARVLPTADEEVRNLDPGRTKGITFQLDTLGDDPGQADLLAHVQGLGVLMQRKGDSNWKCLNMADAHLDGGSSTQVLLPTRLAYLNDVRSPAVTYDNGPLTAEGPLSPCALSGVRLTESGVAALCEEAPSGIDTPLAHFRYAQGAKVPGLVFGETYRIASFMVTNSGAIPKTLSDGNPWQLKKDIRDKDLPPKQAQEETYFREMHVGSLRVQPKDPVALPPIPERVAPRVREFSPLEVLPPGDPLFGDHTRPDLDAQTDSLLAHTPLLLLAKDFPARSGMKVNESILFEVRPPTVDLQTWDRWVAKDASKERRKFIWRSFYQLTHDKGSSTGKLEDAGIYLDDPAVDGIYVEVAELGVANPGSWQSLKLKLIQKKRGASAKPIAADFKNWDEADCTLETEQHETVPISCRVTDEGFVVTAGTETKTFAKTSPARMYRLTVYASLVTDGEKRFLETKTRKEIVRSDGKINNGTSPWHLLIEIPQALPTDPKEIETIEKKLLSALTPDRETAKAGKLTVKLDVSKLDELKGLLYRAELWHQVWHWRGRPPAEGYEDFPQQEPGGEFEMSEFGPRRDDEHRRLPMPRQPGVGEPVFFYEEDLERQGPQGDRRALAHRFSARVFSRWEGILPEERSSLATIDSATEVRWKPHVVPCRHQGVVPMPKVRLVLPLTEGVSENVEDGPGLLVVVDGPWYEVGGLAERLGVEVMPVNDPKVRLDQEPAKEDQYYQLGTDPIVTAESAGEAFDPHPDPKYQALRLDRFEVVFDRIDGAIGHHRDHSQTDPRFLASSFILARPTIRVAGQKKPLNLSWWFLKLRFRRELTIQGQDKPLVSEWSAPFWVQVLPGVERVEEDWLGEEAHEVKLDDRGLTVTGAQRRDPRPGFHLFAVMTRKVIDFAGRPDQEAYLGVWSWNPLSLAWTPDPRLDRSVKTDLYVRFLEVQSKRNPLSKDLWDAIFKADQVDSDRARIVRISKRFTVNGGVR